MLRAEIRLAERLGISPRRLWGEEPVTRLAPDGDGGFLVERESEFTRDDVDMFEAARLAEEAISPRGMLYEDEINPDSNFIVGDAVTNYAIKAVEAARKQWETQHKGQSSAAVSWTVSLRD